MPAISTAPSAPYIPISAILGAPNLCGIIELTVTGVPPIFPEEFYKVTATSKNQMTQVQQYTGQRQLAKVTSDVNGTPAILQQKELGAKGFNLIVAKDGLALNASAYQHLFDYNSLETQKFGMREVTRQITQQKAKLMNLRRVALASMLFNSGKTYVSTTGDILPTSSGAYETIDMEIPSANLGQGVSPVDGNPLISTPWSQDTATIVQDCIRIQQAGVYLTGFPPKLAFYGVSVPQYLAKNTQVQNYLSRTGSGGESSPGIEYLRSGQIPEGLFGFKWIPAYNQMWLDNDNVAQSVVANGAVTFTPEYNNNWIGFHEGTLLVPKTFQPFNADSGGNVMESAFDQREGMSAFAYVPAGSTTVVTTVQDCFLPVLTVPAAVFELLVESGTFS